MIDRFGRVLRRVRRLAGECLTVGLVAGSASAQTSAPAPGPAPLPDPPAVVSVPGLSMPIFGPPPPELPATSARDAAGRLTTRAVRLTAPLKIDGKLDEAVYAAVPAVTGFIQMDPHGGEPATQKTEYWILFDDKNLYVAVRAYESNLAGMVANEMRRDATTLTQNEYVNFSFDTFYDRRNSQIFLVSPTGGRMDGQLTSERQYNGDWNPVWTLRSGRFDGGWTAEASIPFRSLRYRPGKNQVWGLHVSRLNRWKNEIAYLIPMDRARGNAGAFQMSVAPTLVGIEAPPQGKNVEIKPYGIAGMSSDLLANPRISNDATTSAGMDAKIGITEGIAADLSYNTDFAQVEADEQQLNLTRFNLFFPEKREFFLENQGAFQIGPPQQSGSNLIPFFSRTIGLSDAGTPIPIVGGARLSGKVGRSTVGLLNIQTEEEVLASGVRRPASNFSVARFAQEFGSNSSASVFYMGKERAEGSNRLVGGDVRYNLTRNVGFDAMIMRSEKTDVGTGTAWRAGFDADSNLSRVAVSYASLGDTFRDDLGFLPRLGVDILDATVTRRIRPRTGSRLIREWRPELPYTRISRDGFGIQTATISPTLSVDFADGASASYRFRRNEEGLAAPFRIRSDYSIPVGRYTFDDHNVEFSGSRARRLSATGAVRFGDFYDGTREGFTLGGRFRFSPKLAVSLSYGRDFVSLPRLDFTTDLFSLRLDQSFSTRMFLNAFIQYNSVTREVISNVRFNVIHHPLSDLFVVYNETRSRSGALPSRSVVVKLTHLLSF